MTSTASFWTVVTSSVWYVTGDSSWRSRIRIDHVVLFPRVPKVSDWHQMPSMSSYQRVPFPPPAKVPESKQLTCVVQDNLATRFKIGSPPQQPGGPNTDSAQALEPTVDAQAGPSVPDTSAEDIAEIMPGLTPAQREQQQRQLDLDRLNTMSIEDRRAIASMDMMGDYGSKVNYTTRV